MSRLQPLLHRHVSITVTRNNVTTIAPFFLSHWLQPNTRHVHTMNGDVSVLSNICQPKRHHCIGMLRIAVTVKQNSNYQNHKEKKKVNAPATFRLIYLSKLKTGWCVRETCSPTHPKKTVYTQSQTGLLEAASQSPTVIFL